MLESSPHVYEQNRTEVFLFSSCYFQRLSPLPSLSSLSSLDIVVPKISCSLWFKNVGFFSTSMAHLHSVPPKKQKETWEAARSTPTSMCNTGDVHRKLEWGCFHVDFHRWPLLPWKEAQTTVTNGESPHGRRDPLRTEVSQSAVLQRVSYAISDTPGPSELCCSL